MAPKAPLIGIDLLEPERLRQRLKKDPSLRETLFHPGELEYCASRPRPIEHLAARFCAKEAVIKALGLDGFDPLDVEIVSGAERTTVALHGGAKEKAVEQGLQVTVSLTHLPEMAAAVALAVPLEG